MSRFSAFLWIHGTARRAWLSFAGLSALLLGENLAPCAPGAVYMRRVTNGLNFLDFGYAPATGAHALLTAFGAEGRHTQALLGATVDVAIPFASAAFGALAITALGRALFKRPGRWQLLAYLPLVAALLDYSENASIAGLLLTYPNDPAWLSVVTHALTSVKFLAYNATAAVVLVAAIVALARQSWRKSGADQRSPAN